MSELLLEKVAEAIHSLERYRFRIEHTPGVIHEGVLDLSQERQYVQIGLSPEDFPRVEIIWIGEKGYGRRLKSDLWMSLRGRPFPNYLQFTLEMLEKSRMISVTEEDQLWKADVEIINIPILEEPEETCRAIFKELEWDDEMLINRMTEMSRNISLVSHIWISQEDHLIEKITVTAEAPRLDYQMTMTFSRDVGETPVLKAEDIDITNGKARVSTLIFFSFSKLGGWQERLNHCPWAQRSLDLTKESDQIDKEYTEIYHGHWCKVSYPEKSAKKPVEDQHHPIVVGSYYEDQTKMPTFYNDWFATDPHYITDPGYYFTQNAYCRDYNHYGGAEEGLTWQEHFKYDDRGDNSPLLPGKCYYSAKNWGYGGDIVKPEHNRFTFTEAIKQYNRYSLHGKRIAYLMLGHVLHLLQDVGQPDHAKLAPHPASGMSDPEAYERFKTCLILASEVAFVAAVSALDLLLAFGIAYAACKRNINANEVGYERLIGEYWTLSLKSGNPAISAEEMITSIVSKPDYDTYFKELADLSIQISLQEGLKSPLGLGDLKVIAPQVSGCDPDIDITNAEQKGEFFELTKKIVPSIICYGAGFIRHFYETVNYPPYVERVVVVKAVPGLTPMKFARFDEALYGNECSKAQVRYDVRWEQVDDTRRTNVVDTPSMPLSPNHEAYIFIQFGPTIEPIKSKTVYEETLAVDLVGQAPDGSTINTPVKLKSSYDDQIGHYYWGSFRPTNPWKKEYSLTIEIHAYDASAHLSKRTYPGDEIDSNPETVALVNPDKPPLYPFIGYEPGVDRHHSITIGLPIRPDQLEPNNTFDDNLKKLDLVSSKFSLYSADSDPTSKSYTDLTLHDEDDIDLFLIECQESNWGEWLPASGGVIDFGGSGITLVPSPPRLEIWVAEKSGGCVAVDVYHFNYALYKQVTTATKLGIWSVFIISNPDDIFKNSQEIFIALKNPDFARQGPLQYDLSVRLVGAGFSVTGRLLYKFWELSGLGPFPPPPYTEHSCFLVCDPPDEKVWCFNPSEFITHMEEYVPQLIEDIGFDSRLDKQIKEADVNYALGQVAHTVELYVDAERFYLQSSEVFQQAELGLKEANVLRDLKDLYAVQGRMDEVSRIGCRLEALSD